MGTELQPIPVIVGSSQSVIHNQQSSFLSNKLPFPSPQRDSQSIQFHVMKADIGTVERPDISVSVPKQLNNASQKTENVISKVKNHQSSLVLEEALPKTDESVHTIILTPK